MTVATQLPPVAQGTLKAPSSTKGSYHKIPSRQVRVVPPRRRSYRKDSVYKCDSIQDWLRPEALDYNGMLTVRPQTWPRIQTLADHFADSGLFGEDQSLQKYLPLAEAHSSDDALRAMLDGAAEEILAPLAGLDLPEGLAAQIRKDAAEMGVVTANLVPSAKKMSLKLELIGEMCCVRWHQDAYVSRAIVSYNLRGTEYIHDDYVDFWELNNCGNNACVVKDRTPVCRAGVGDILFIKGTLYPAQVNGLVHRSPDQVYHPNGKVMTRLVLKVDVNA